ncbi:MAG: hypothetical protein R3Y09_10495 [Clostridia bacterium]
MEQKIRKSKILKVFLIVLCLFALLTVAGYTLFTLLGKDASVTDMEISVSAPYGLELTLDKDDEDSWGQICDFTEFFGDNPIILKPVTWSDVDETFYSAAFGIDGRILGISKALSDEEHTNSYSDDGYYAKLTFYARSDLMVDVSLLDALTSFDGLEGYGTYVIGMPAWDTESQTNVNAGKGMQHSIRVGFDVTIYDEYGQVDNEYFYIYEPNVDEPYVATPSIDGNETLVSEDRLITQTESIWYNTTPAEASVVILSPGEFTGDTNLFSLDENKEATINLYVWLEGQDPDCTNQLLVVHDGDEEDTQIFINIRLDVETTQESQSGLEPMQ